MFVIQPRNRRRRRLANDTTRGVWLKQVMSKELVICDSGSDSHIKMAMQLFLFAVVN